MLILIVEVPMPVSERTCHHYYANSNLALPYNFKNWKVFVHLCMIIITTITLSNPDIVKFIETVF